MLKHVLILHHHKVFFDRIEYLHKIFVLCTVNANQISVYCNKTALLSAGHLAMSV